jgi:2-C-methyl-D-erythritol 4-phosphate cytidylyltransferase
MSRVHVIVVATSPLAFLKLGKSSVLTTAVARARLAKSSPSVSVWIAEQAVDAWNRLPHSSRPDCVANVGVTLEDATQDVTADFVLIHDAQRPLTLPSTFDRVLDALESGLDATRPAHIVVDTLKTIDDEGRVTGTVNRDSVQSLTSPEGFRRSAIDFNGVAKEWALPLKADSNADYVVGDQESLRIREPEDVLLVESFLAWQTFTSSQER